MRISEGHVERTDPTSGCRRWGRQCSLGSQSSGCCLCFKQLFASVSKNGTQVWLGARELKKEKISGNIIMKAI
jgi:hypothetical protein